MFVFLDLGYLTQYEITAGLSVGDFRYLRSQDRNARVGTMEGSHSAAYLIEFRTQA